MREIMQVRDAVIEALQEAGLNAMAAFPAENAAGYPDAVMTVSVDSAEGKNMCFCNYLGEVYDSTEGTVRERYGKHLDGTITVEIRGSSAETCEEACVEAADVLAYGLPSGICGGELRWEALHWEKETEMFLCRGQLQCQAVFMATSQNEEQVFLDFRLKGVKTS